MFFYIQALIHIIKNTTPQKTIFIFFFVFVLIIIVGLNGNNDEYSRIYLRAPTIKDFFYEGEYWTILYNNIFIESGILFVAVISFFKTLQISSQAVILFYVIISLSIISIFYKKFTRYYMIAFLIYIAHSMLSRELSGIRDGFIGSIVLYLIFSKANGKQSNFYYAYILSVLHHFMSIISIIVNFLDHKISKKNVFILIFVAYSIYILNLPIVILSFFNEFNLLPSIVVNYIYGSSYSYDLGLYFPKTIQQTVTILLLVSVYEKEKLFSNENKYFNLVFNSYLFGTLCLIVFSEYAIFATRFNGLFLICEPICITYLLIFLTQNKLISHMLILFILLVGFYNYIFSGKINNYNFLVDWENENIKNNIYLIEKEEIMPR